MHARKFNIIIKKNVIITLTIVIFVTRRADRVIYMGTKEHPQSLLWGMEDDLLDPELDDDLMKFLNKFGAKSNALNY